MDGKLIAYFVLQICIDEHGAADEVALDLVGQTLEKGAVHRQTHAAHPEGVAEFAVPVNIGLVHSLHEAGDSGQFNTAF